MVYDIAVVGSGFSAIAVTIHLLQLLPPTRSIAVIGDDPEFGRGAAYRSEFHLHRLNVPAARMSVFPESPDDFVDWLRRRGKNATLNAFAPRSDYGLYLRDTLAALLRKRDRARLDLIRAKATACLGRSETGIVFRLDNSDELTARNVVLCVGMNNARLPLGSDRVDERARQSIVDNPWRLGWLSKVKPDETLCILGSGLTMIDQVLALRQHGHRGKIHVLSRRGLLPHAHLSSVPGPVPVQLPEASREISHILASLRRQAGAAANWRCVMDGLRPLTRQLWQSLTAEQRARFLRHALPWWNIHRHRIPPAISERFDSLVRDGTVTIQAGLLHSISKENGGVNLHYRPRGRSDDLALQVNRIINCTGLERAGIDHSPLLRDMRQGGLLRADTLGFGIDVNAASQVLRGNGKPHQDIFAIGALTAGQFWEITAVPDIRVQAQKVAQALMSNSL
ncbi:FAD/NAD(P)-binding protein [Phyllobacterium leguminum]|uniref:FAD/NAD(P)-binding protein n=1 Tax=Phyllobacterium leguminum TaxID=314237 RepID=UPI000DA1BA63|nr:FAD/NAD(P)-binding protein [Phyllobacterium leguminum]